MRAGGRRPSRRRRPPCGDDGTILLLSIGFCLLAILLVWGVIDASIVFLDRRDLAAAVDGTALAAAQQLDEATVYAQGTAGDLPLDPTQAASTVSRYVADTYPPGEFPGWTITGGVGAGGRVVRVAGSRTLTLPLVGTVTVRADSSADSRVHDRAPLP